MTTEKKKFKTLHFSNRTRALRETHSFAGGTVNLVVAQEGKKNPPVTYHYFGL